MQKQKHQGMKFLILHTVRCAYAKSETKAPHFSDSACEEMRRQNRGATPPFTLAQWAVRGNLGGCRRS